jgi:hypothetical protein
LRCSPPPQTSCAPVASAERRSLAALVRAYLTHNRPRALTELQFFRNMPSLEVAVHYAGLATDQREKRFSHQCRIPLPALRKGRKLLLGRVPQLAACGSFHKLHTLLSELFASVRGLGHLYTYDTALRVGAYLGLEPEHVYLHAGTRAGARALGLKVVQGYIEVSALPRQIRVLAPHEAEDFLCIYKSQFAAG